MESSIQKEAVSPFRIGASLLLKGDALEGGAKRTRQKDVKDDRKKKKSYGAPPYGKKNECSTLNLQERRRPVK